MKKITAAPAAAAAMPTTAKKTKSKVIDWDAVHRRDEERNIKNKEDIYQREARLAAERAKLLAGH
jgi:hypothetical protein